MTDPANDDAESLTDSVTRTITLTEREIRAVAQILNALTGVDDDRGRDLTKIVEKSAGASSDQYRQLLVKRARQTFSNRALRSKHFHSVMFGEAAWDMLLALYVSDQSGARHTVSGLVNLAGVAQTTALRWLNFLERKQLVARRANPTDRRVYYIELTDAGLGALDAYFSELIAMSI